MYFTRQRCGCQSWTYKKKHPSTKRQPKFFREMSCYQQSCHLINFQNLVFSEQADIVWVTETWLRDDIENSEILSCHGVTSYTIYRKDRKTRDGGVLRALKSRSFSSSCEIVPDSDLELIALELASTCNQKYLAGMLYLQAPAKYI